MAQTTPWRKVAVRVECLHCGIILDRRHLNKGVPRSQLLRHTIPIGEKHCPGSYKKGKVVE